MFSISTPFKFITLLLISPIIIGAETQTPAPSYTFNNNPNISAHPTYTTTISPNFYTTTTSTINAVGIQIRDITLQILDKAQNTFSKDNYTKAKDAIKEFLWEYRYTITAYTFLVTYASISVTLITDYHYLTSSDHWARWKPDHNFEMLCALPRATLEEELLHAIGQQHYNKIDPTDFTHPLIQFINNIEQEIKISKRYISMAKIIKKLHLMTILPTNDKKIGKVNMLLKRLLFIKHIFLSWLTERNLAANISKKIHL